MNAISWTNEFAGQPEEIDPGKDIFALLFLSFFLINAVIMFCVSDQAGMKKVELSTANSAGQVEIKMSDLARIQKTGDVFAVVKGDARFVLPQDMGKLVKSEILKTETDSKGNPVKMLIIEDPGTSMSAGEVLRVVDMLNREGIGADFRRADE